MSGAPPVVSAVSRPWWDALARHEIMVQRCDSCAAWVFYPRVLCPECGGRYLTWTRVEGQATLYSWTVTEVPVAKAFADLGKPILAVVELANGARVPTTLVDAERDRVTIGMSLEPVFDSTSYEGFTLLRFRRALGG